MSPTVSIVPLGPEHTLDLQRFLAAIGDADQTFLGNSDLRDIRDESVEQLDGRHYLALMQGETALEAQRVVGLSSVTIGTGWSRHVGQLRVIVDSGLRRSGLGGQLALAAVAGAHQCGLEKVFVEVRSDQERVQSLFTRLGFRPEALLTDHLKDPQGHTYDLLTLAHRIDEVQGLLIATGLAQVRT